MLSKIFGKLMSSKATPQSAEEIKQAAREGDETARTALASREDIEPELLYFLAADPSPKVRGLIAANAATPRKADLMLATDNDESVRGSLAEKIVRAAPGLTAGEQDRLRSITYEALSLLARDQAPRIRQILSEALKEVADAPPDVIRRLAWDVEAAVATPVLRFSPVLTDQDLIEIVKAKPSPKSVAAICERKTVSENVSDAIVDSDDIDAIALLLANRSAQIREEALDRLLDRAVDIDLWHMPLAMRPKLPSAVAVKIARFVAEDILNRMLARHDLSPDAVSAVRAVVHKRLGDGEALVAVSDSPPAAADGVKVDDDTAFDRAMELWSSGKLDEATFKTALTSDRKLAAAMIAVMADLPFSAVEQALKHKSAKGCVALAWKAGLTPSLAEDIQMRLAGISSRDLIKVRGEYPMSEENLAWQIDFIRDL